VEIREWAPVSEILVENGKVRGVKLQDGSEEYADRVLVTAGAWTTALLKTAGVDLPLWGEKHEILITEPWNEYLVPWSYHSPGVFTYSNVLMGHLSWDFLQ